jgi:hypothetical protein
MQTARKSAKPVSADAIPRLADRGEDVSRFFKGQGRMVRRWAASAERATGRTKE